MNFSAITGNLVVILLIIGLTLLFLFRRRRKPVATYRDIALSLLFEVRLNLSLTEIFRPHWQVRKFETVHWQLTNTKLSFLAEPVSAALTDAYGMAEDFNQKISAAKKHKSLSYIENINIEKLKEALNKSKTGLEEWLLASTGRIEPPPQYPSMFDALFGGRRF